MNITDLPKFILKEIFEYCDDKKSRKDLQNLRLTNKRINDICDSILAKHNELFEFKISFTKEFKENLPDNFTDLVKVSPKKFNQPRLFKKEKSEIFRKQNKLDITFQKKFNTPKDDDSESFFGSTFFSKKYRKIPIINISADKLKMDPKLAASQIDAHIMRGTSETLGEHFFTVRIENPVKGKTYAIVERHAYKIFILLENEKRSCLKYFWTITELNTNPIVDNSEESIFHKKKLKRKDL